MQGKTPALVRPHRRCRLRTIPRPPAQEVPLKSKWRHPTPESELTTTVLGPGADAEYDACLDFTSNRWAIYACGFRKAAEYLLDRVLESPIGQDALVYPIVFNARHYIEMDLKALLWDASRLVDQPLSKVPLTHRIDQLWSKARPLLVDLHGGDQGFETVDRLVAALAEVDPTGEAFRYPIDSKGTPALGGLERINLVQFRDHLEHASMLLDGADAAIGEYLEIKNSEMV